VSDHSRESRLHNDELLLHVQLINVGNGIQLWGAQFKETYSDVLSRPEKAADRICDQLLPILAPRMPRSRGEIEVAKNFKSTPVTLEAAAH
jgi:hypothetical protein